MHSAVVFYLVHARIQTEREGGTPLENHKAIGFLSNTCPDHLTDCQASLQSFWAIIGTVFVCLKVRFSFKIIDLKQIIISLITYSESLLLARGQNIFISLDRILIHNIIGQLRLSPLEHICPFCM